MAIRKGIKRIKTPKVPAVGEPRKFSTTQKPVHNGNTKHPWEEIKDAYVTSPSKTTYKELGARYGVSPIYIGQRAAKERWTYLRAEHFAELAKTKRETHLEWTLDEGIKFDKSSLETAKLGMALVTRRLVELNQLVTANEARAREVVERIKQGLPVTKEEKYWIVNYRELESLARSALAFQEIGRKALGTDVQNIDLSVHGEVTEERVVTIGLEASRDDPERLSAFLEAMQRAGIANLDFENGKLEIEGAPHGLEEEDSASEDMPDIVDAVIVEEGKSA